MRVYLNGKFTNQQLSGVQRVAIQTIVEVDNLLKQKYLFDKIEIYLLIPDNPREEYQKLIDSLQIIKIIKINTPIKNLNFWEQVILPIYVLSRKSDKLINFTNSSPLIVKKQIVYVHDAAVYDVPSSYSFYFRIWYKFMHNFIKKSDDLVTVSNFSKKQLVLNKVFSSEKISVIHNGIDHLIIKKTNDAIIEKLKLENKGYFLTLGSNNPTKNQNIIVDLARKNQNIIFVVVGGENKVFKKNSLNQSELSNLIFTGYLKDEEISSLYKNARAFIFPSKYEGFGLPPLEALMNDTGVICSNIEIMREILDDNAIYFDLESLEDLNTLINDQNLETLLNDSKRNKEKTLIKYQWKKSAEKLIDIIKK